MIAIAQILAIVVGSVFFVGGFYLIACMLLAVWQDLSRR